jgi:hypothetical protein
MVIVKERKIIKILGRSGSLVRKAALSKKDVTQILPFEPRMCQAQSSQVFLTLSDKALSASA